MVEIMPFGRYSGKSVEQIALEDYKYFFYILSSIPLKKPSLRERFRFVNHVGNNFVSVQECKNQECNNPAELISVYHNWYMDCRSSSRSFIYCSEDCFNEDPNVTNERNKIELMPLGFGTVLSRTKYDTKALMRVVTECMGLKEGRRTKEYLEDFFNRCQLRVPFA